MNLENQVCTLEQAKRLVELGVDKESEYFWGFWEGEDKQPVLLNNSDAAQARKRAVINGIDNYHDVPSYTTAELGEMLPRYVETKDTGNIHFLSITKGTGDWKVNYDAMDMVDYLGMWKEKELVWSMADALIWLLENNYITAQQINEAA